MKYLLILGVLLLVGCNAPLLSGIPGLGGNKDCPDTPGLYKAINWTIAVSLLGVGISVGSLFMDSGMVGIAGAVGSLAAAITGVIFAQLAEYMAIAGLILGILLLVLCLTRYRAAAIQLIKGFQAAKTAEPYKEAQNEAMQRHLDVKTEKIVAKVKGKL